MAKHKPSRCVTQEVTYRNGVRIHYRASVAKRFRVRDPWADYIEGATWWLAKSKHSTEKLQKLFARGDVASCLFERVGSVIPLRKDGEKFVIQIQVVDGEPFTDLCLSEIGVVLEEVVQVKLLKG